MRIIKMAISVGALSVLFGGTLMFMRSAPSPRAGSAPVQPLLSRDNVLVHAGWISRSPGDGYASDYHDDNEMIWAAVAAHSSGPDSCYTYVSTDGGSTWNQPWTLPPETGMDLTNMQVVTGEGSNLYNFFFVLDEGYGSVILWRNLGLSWSKYIISDGNNSFCATRDDPDDDNYYLFLARETIDGEVVFLYSSNFGVNWQNRDTVDGDMPHLATAGLNGEDLYLTWRLDGEDGALWGTCGFPLLVTKMTGWGNWTYFRLGDEGESRCLLRASDGTIYVGLDTIAPPIDTWAAVWKTEDGGETWQVTGDMGQLTGIYDLLEEEVGTIYAASKENTALGYRARVYKTTNGGQNWSNTGAIGTAGDDKYATCLAQSPVDGSLYVGTGMQGDLFKSTNEGSSWNEVGELAGMEYIHAVIVTSSGTVLAGGTPEHGSGDSLGIFRSTDGGDYFTHIRPGGVKDVSALFQASDGIVYAAVKDGAWDDKILRSTDDGVTWQWTTYYHNSDSYRRVRCITEDHASDVYATNDSCPVYKTTDHGDTWIYVQNSSFMGDLVQSKHQIMVKRSTDRGSTWGDAAKLSGSLRDKSDPEVAGTNTSSYTTWVAYSERAPSGDWDVKYAYSTGADWYKNLTLRGGSGSDQHMCDLRCPRGSSYRVHAAYYSDETGSRKLYHRSATRYDPTNWSDTLRVTDLRPTTSHAPEISFYRQNPVIFYSWDFGIPIPHPYNLYVNAESSPEYDCGDVNGDEITNVGDIVYVVSYLYKSGPSPEPECLGDVNCDGIVNVGDVVYLVSYLYKAGPVPCPDCCSP